MIWWTTKSGKKILIYEMTNPHLLNAIKMIERIREEKLDAVEDAYSFFGDCRGEMASYYAGHMADEASNEYSRYFASTKESLEALLAEASRRRLWEWEQMVGRTKRKTPV